MIYKIVDDRDWQKICEALLQLRELSQTSGAYAYLRIGRRFRSVAERLVRDLTLEDHVHFLEAGDDIPDRAVELPS